MILAHHQHHHSRGPITYAADLLEAIMGETQYILHADQLGADASTVSSWGPFTSEGSPVVDADGYLGSLKTLNFNGTSQSLLHPTTGLITSGGSYTMAMAYTVPDVTTNSTRELYSFASGSSSTEQHCMGHVYASGVLNSYVRNSGNTSLNWYPAQHNPVILIVHRTSTHTRIKFYQSANTSSYYDIAQASMTLGATPAHEIGKRATQAVGYTRSRLRFAALSVNQTALDEAGMDALASFLQSGPYNCPLT